MPSSRTSHSSPLSSTRTGELKGPRKQIEPGDSAKKRFSKEKKAQNAVEMLLSLTLTKHLLINLKSLRGLARHLWINASVDLMSSLLIFVQRVSSARLRVIVAAPLTSLGVFDASADDFTLIGNGGERQLMIAGGISDPGSELITPAWTKQKSPVRSEGFHAAYRKFWIWFVFPNSRPD
jgi:hypothetical protein